MKRRGILASILFIGWFGVAPTVAASCCHHGDHCDDGGDYHDSYSDDCCHHGQGSGHCHWMASDATARLQAVEGKIAEIEYLPGATPESGMVEIQLQTAGQSRLIRLAPVGYLRQSGLVLREGDTLSVKVFSVAGMEGDFLVATEVHKGDKALSVRDSRGRPAW